MGFKIYHSHEEPAFICFQRVRCEVPVKRILLVARPEDVTNMDSFENPAALDDFMRMAEDHVNLS
jgi:hypothetical protein